MNPTDRTAARVALQRQIPVSQMLADRERDRAYYTPKTNVSYNNGVLFQDGKRATPEQIKAYDATNPYLSKNWEATPEDRGGRIPGALPDVPALTTPRTPAPQLDPQLADQLVALSMQRNIPVPELLLQLMGRSSTPSHQGRPVSTAAAPLVHNSTPPLTTPLPGLTTRSGQPRKPLYTFTPRV